MSPFPKEPLVPDNSLCSPAKLEASYTRCRSLQVPVELDKPNTILPKIALGSRLMENSVLLTLVEQIMSQEHYAGSQIGNIYIFCDQELMALKINAIPEVLDNAEQVGVKPGTFFTEESCGTNALALAQEHGRIIAIRGKQHYCALFKDWWCVAGPIKNAEDRIVGYLDISMHAAKEIGTTVALIKTLLDSIKKEYYLLEIQQQLEQAGVRPPSHALPPEVEHELTAREREIFQLSLLRLTNKEISQRLNISVGTVITHRRNIYQKVGVHSLTELLSRFGC
ncbi:MAG: LuxR C-terminal-related transcriptional regulator [Bacillota bacterium]